MAQDEGRSVGTKPASRPKEYNATVASPSGATSRPDPQGKGASLEHASASSMPRMTKFSKGHVVARRGNHALRGFGSRRSSASSQRQTPETSRGARSNVQESGEVSPPTQLPEQPNREESIRVAVLKNHTERHMSKVVPDTYSAPADDQRPALVSPKLENHIPPIISQGVVSSKPSQAVIDSSKDNSLQPSQSPDAREGGAEDVASSPQTTVSRSDSPSGGYHEVRPKEGKTAEEAETQSSIHVATPPWLNSYYQTGFSDTIEEPKLSVTTAHSPRSTSSRASSDSGRAADVESNEEDEHIRPFARSRRRQVAAIEDSSESEPDAPDPVAPNEESDDESMSMSLDSIIVAEKPQDNDTTQCAVESESVQDQGPPPKRLQVLPATAKRMATFDSDAFDSLIYRHSRMQAPKGVKIAKMPPKHKSSPNYDDRLFLPINPAIHRPYKRSEEWYREKSKEIKIRGGRKKWFGRIHERRRFLRAQEDAKEKERERAIKAGKTPLPRDPQPRMLTKIGFLADYDNEELPTEVQENDAWVKAVEWFRETQKEMRQKEDQARQNVQVAQQETRRMERKQLLLRTEAETARFFKDTGLQT